MRLVSCTLAQRAAALLLGLALFGAATTARATDLTGKWSGCWVDCKSGHNGPLHGTFCKCDESHYQVTFTGRFFGVFPFRYQVVLNVTGRDGDKVLLAGENNLPFFGTFTYTAEATGTGFTANFLSCRYNGRFELKRCCP